jgi:hypothetical protein
MRLHQAIYRGHVSGKHQLHHHGSIGRMPPSKVIPAIVIGSLVGWHRIVRRT